MKVKFVRHYTPYLIEDEAHFEDDIAKDFIEKNIAEEVIDEDVQKGTKKPSKKRGE